MSFLLISQSNNFFKSHKLWHTMEKSVYSRYVICAGFSFIIARYKPMLISCDRIIKGTYSMKASIVRIDTRRVGNIKEPIGGAGGGKNRIYCRPNGDKHKHHANSLPRLQGAKNRCFSGGMFAPEKIGGKLDGTRKQNCINRGSIQTEMPINDRI